MRNRETKAEMKITGGATANRKNLSEAAQGQARQPQNRS